MARFEKMYFLVPTQTVFHVCDSTIVFVWSRNGANWTKAFVRGLLAPEFNIVGGAACFSTICLYNICKCYVILSK